ncbi:MAG: hypothetical protein A3F12_07420 [Gammaproteobacteria bacterium RIFCSPHIGHO2_12_FULL_38_14]|nr:MAG: hypothetical protein A3F12_07420 [Gammaproteobacteria bacterium RIFCSPHIGHO2_12_FULL_38_14]
MRVMQIWQNLIETYRHDKRVPIGIAIFCALGLLMAAGQLIADFSNHFTASKVIATQPVQSLPVIANLHLFGSYNQLTTDLPITQLQLSLVGTVVMIDAPDQSRALIAAAGGPVKIYQTGAALPGNAIISKIEQNYIVLNQNGTLEKLLLPIKMLTTDPID